jgi:hypothetical protein
MRPCAAVNCSWLPSAHPTLAKNLQDEG